MGAGPAARIAVGGTMIFAARLREGVMSGAITASVRIWRQPRVKLGGRYALGGGHVVVTAIREISLADVTPGTERASGSFWWNSFLRRIEEPRREAGAPR
jgi:hypothetical protein